MILKRLTKTINPKATTIFDFPSFTVSIFSEDNWVKPCIKAKVEKRIVSTKKIEIMMLARLQILFKALKLLTVLESFEDAETVTELLKNVVNNNIK